MPRNYTPGRGKIVPHNYTPGRGKIGAVTGCIAATRSAVAPRYTPGRGKIVPRN